MFGGKAGKPRCQKRAMHDQPGITLVSTVAGVVVDAMAVEGDRGISKQRDFAKLEGVALVRLAGLHGRIARKGTWLAIDNVLQFGDDGRVALMNFMPQRDQSKPAASSPLFLDVVQCRHLLGGKAGPEGRVKREPTPGPHANWQAHFRNEASGPRVSVASDSGFGHGVPEEGKMREGRQNVTRLDARRPVQRSQQRLRARWIYPVGDGHGLRH